MQILFNLSIIIVLIILQLGLESQQKTLSQMQQTLDTLTEETNGH